MSSPEKRFRVLVLVPGALGDRLSGPEIRAVRLARALSAEHEVTLMDRGGRRYEHEGIAVVPFSRLRLVREARRHDVLMAPVVPPFALLLKRWLGILAVSDQYDPVELEVGTLENGASRARATARAARLLQLRCADVVLCGGQRQRELLEVELDRLDDGISTPLYTVPFGIDDDPQPPKGSPLRDRFPQIAEDDRVVLWWGSLWRWLDPETAIRAFASIADSHPDVKLVFTAGPPPNGTFECHSVVGTARKLAKQLGVLGRTVLFLDDWVPFDRRGDYLQEADVGLTLHRATEEAPLAARARYMDYLWAGLPCVIARGDETADRFAATGFATLVEPGSTEGVAREVLGMLEGPAQTAARSARRVIADEFRWDCVAAPLLGAMAGVGRDRTPAGRPPELWRTTSYYLRRLLDRAPLMH